MGKKSKNTAAATPVKSGPNVSSGEITGINEVKLEEIVADSDFNARKDYEGTSTDKEDPRQSLESLAESIKRDGLHQPVCVRKRDDGKYDLIYGFRRFLATQMLAEKQPDKYSRIKASIWEGTDEDAYLVNLTENTSRNDLRPWELAERCAFLKSKFGLTGTIIGQRVGKAKTYVDNLIRFETDVHPTILKEWHAGNRAVTTTQLKEWVTKSKDDQLAIWNGVTAAANGASNGANGANAGTPGPDPRPPGTQTKPSGKMVAKCLEALKTNRTKQKEFRQGAIAMYNFLMGFENSIPGVFSRSKEANKPKSSKPAKVNEAEVE